MKDRPGQTRPAATDAPFGTEVKRSRWPMILLWTLYFVWGAALIVLAVLKIRAESA